MQLGQGLVEGMRGWLDMTAPPPLPQHPLMQRRQPLVLPLVPQQVQAPLLVWVLPIAPQQVQGVELALVLVLVLPLVSPLPQLALVLLLPLAVLVPLLLLLALVQVQAPLILLLVRLKIQGYYWHERLQPGVHLTRNSATAKPGRQLFPG